jgi:catechol 2,3-dioxygenase-like lactoylglutathione lyase family enzyme
MTATSWALTIDCANAGVQARFWVEALGYVHATPPEGWRTWEDWLRHFDVPEDEWDDGASLMDPDGVLPKIGFLRVPEPKSAKNRLHLDLHVSGGRQLPAAIRAERIQAKVTDLLAAGATVLAHEPGPDGSLDHVVLADPEGNEFCVV